MPVLTYSPEQFVADLDMVTPADRIVFNRLLGAIRIAVELNSDNIDPAELEGTFHTIKNERGIIIAKTRIGRTRNMNHYSLAEFHGYHPDFTNYGIIAVASIFDLPTARNINPETSVILSVSGQNRYATDEVYGEPLQPLVLDELTREVQILANL